MNNTKTQYFPISQLREQLRQRGNDLAYRLSRSVARLTSCDALPCEEYGEEVQYQQTLVQELLYIQHCRTALERCIAGHGVNMRYRWSADDRTVTRFRKVGPGRVKVTGLTGDLPQK